MAKRAGLPGVARRLRPPNTQEPFAWAIASDNKTIVGADMDGYFRITLISPDSIEKCYTHNGTSPTRSIVATCHVMNRVRR
jgi:hypothetical protein